ncbi:malonyl-[acyl-carrier protein] O-methyltransferase [mine drainage metagenome]|uniref:Malonyl-[acyl-carrier protein] O-methyltransferase n=1 Tax=mine drainage metagenome TaxID=410659 RepID=A0A1J5S5C0_9ZZZZ
MKAEEYDAWYRTPRGRWVGDVEYALLSGMLGARRGETLLDIGCGTGYFTRRFARDAGLAAMGIDIDREWVAYAASRSGDVPFLVGDARRLPFADASFDTTIAVTSLCFVEDERSAIAEIIRVTRRRFAIGLLNRHSLLFLQKGIEGGRGAYRGARWHSANEIRALFEGLPVTDLAMRTAVCCPEGGSIAKFLEKIVPQFLGVGGFIAVAGSTRRS